jgi:NADH dehydrogenase
MITQANVDTLVTVFGGSGFLGRHVVRALCKRGYRIRVAVRRPDLAFHLQPLGRVGQIHAVSANVRHRGSVEAAARGADIVINLVGVLYEHGRQRFEAVHAFGAEAVALAAAAFGARLIHVSALGAAADSPSLYARSKATGERLTLAAMPSATILRPSILFGPEDDFFNRFAALARMAPALPLIGGGHTRFQPVFAGDVASAVLAVIDRAEAGGAVYELGGPEVRDFKALMQFMLGVIGRKRLLLPIPFSAARLMAFFLQLPTALVGAKPQLTRDQVDLLRADNVVSAEAEQAGRTLAGLGIDGVAMEAIVPSYLWRFRKAGQFTRQAAG